ALPALQETAAPTPVRTGESLSQVWLQAQRQGGADRRGIGPLPPYHLPRRSVILTPGRARRQGSALNEGKVMSTQITLTLPDELVQRARGLARRIGCPVDEVLVRFLQSSLAPLGPEAEERPITEWADESVLAAADLRMSPEEDARFSELLSKQQASALTGPEQGELSGLMLAYQEGLL